MEEEKTFTMTKVELKAALMMAAAHASLTMLSQNFKSASEGSKMVETAVNSVLMLVLEGKGVEC